MSNNCFHNSCSSTIYNSSISTCSTTWLTNAAAAASVASRRQQSTVSHSSSIADILVCLLLLSAFITIPIILGGFDTKQDDPVPQQFPSEIIN